MPDPRSTVCALPNCATKLTNTMATIPAAIKRRNAWMPPGRRLIACSKISTAVAE
eukprot:CAMPEP_0176234166 /NCGR_PEP_ID=MMETSP0121_2-20121125/26196_1 /TAXON_ID=160619 /ORGANISM="Kryptoperidinium foliaceum, Strain CCMP 1326" /LENGTH=54 /DNA_ID=CAMNT_0017573575 /DNA_START=556 /DNA_END=717 /DNA_ORIENTATION=+